MKIFIENKIESINAVSYLVPSLFFVCCGVFFSVNSRAFSSLDMLNVLQFNILGVSYSFIIALFGYTLPGVLIIILWLLLYYNGVCSSGELLIFAMSGFLLISLGSIGYNNSFKERSIYVMIASLSFPLLNALGYVINILKNKKSGIDLFILSVLAVYVVYDIIIRFALYDQAVITANASTLLSFAYYFRLPSIIFQSINKKSRLS